MDIFRTRSSLIRTADVLQSFCRSETVCVNVAAVVRVLSDGKAETLVMEGSVCMSGSGDATRFGVWISSTKASTGVASQVSFPVQSFSVHLRLLGH